MENEKVKEIKKALEQQGNCGIMYEVNNHKRTCKFINYTDILTLINELEKEKGELKQHITEVEKGIINIARERNKKEELASKFIDIYNDSLKQFAEKLKEKKTKRLIPVGLDQPAKEVWFIKLTEEEIDEALKEFINKGDEEQ